MAPTVPIDFAGQKQSLMGKSRKYSKGQLSGFVPDYRHAVETMGESEGFGSSGRVDTEMTASEDSCAPSKRKCISLNVDGHDSFGLTMQVLQLSRMSRSERKDLEVRLNSELEQVRDLQKKIATMSSAIVLSPASDIRSCSDGKTRPPVEAYHRPAELTGPQGKKRAPHGRNGSRNKKSLSAHVESVRPVAASNAQLMKQCEGLLNQLMKHQHAWVFKHPVDVVKLNIPDYFTVIKHPMDLGTVKSKIASGGYLNPLSFAADVRLTFSNAMTYNPPGNDVHIMAEILSKYFEQRWKAVEKKLPVDVDALPFRAPLHTEIIETATPMPPSKKKKTTPNDSSFKPVKPVKPEIVKHIMTDEEKHKLTMEVDSLLGELPESIIDFLKEHSGEGQTSDDEIEIDFEILSDDTLFALRKLLDEYLLEKEKRLAKAEPCEMEILNEPGFSNSSLHPCKGNDMVDEDVDIVGGNDAPMSSFPPVEIEKDAGHRNSKCSSSSSSSSESGSSSSDSDSASSSESESRVPKASPTFGGGKEKLGSEANSEPKRSDPGGSEIGNDPINGVVPVEQKSPSKPISVEEGERQEEESAPPERQVSPEKLYRAALLRNRFADTIFKAKEKALLEKGDKLDPEKLRIEREELERRRKEEKARLQAEARAAEEARKKAEEEAAAEARRQRELEREAARQALQMMEKTVEINENSRFMEDLEMFRAGDDDHLPHYIEETSPEHSHNEPGSFKLQGSSNPLEQLGLFMKADDDIEIEEEEIDPSRNVEEGPSHNELGSVKENSNPLEQLGLFMKADDDTEIEEEIDPSKNVEEGPSHNELGSVKLQESSNPLEQLGLFKKVDDDIEMEEEEIDPSRNVEEGASFKLQESSNPLEQLGLFKKVDDDTEMEEEEIDPSRNVEEGASFKLQESSNPLEQLGLFKKVDDDTEMEEEEIDPSRNVEEGASFKLQESSNPLEQLGLLKKVDDDIEMEEEEIDPSRNVEEGASFKLQESSNPLEQLGLFKKTDDDVEMEEEESDPSRHVEEGASFKLQESSNPLEQEEEIDPIRNVEEGASFKLQESSNPLEQEEEIDPPRCVGEALSNDVEERPSNDVEVGPSNVEAGPSDGVEEARPSNEVEEAGPSNDVEGPSNDVEGPSNVAEQVPPDEVDVEGPPNEVVVEGPPNEVVVEGLPNKVDVEEGPGNDIGGGPDLEEGPGNDIREGPLDEVDVEGPPNEAVVEGLPYEVDVEEGPGNDIGGGPDMEKGPGNDIGEGPGIVEGPGNDMGEGPGNDMEEGPANDMGEGPGNDMEEGPGNDMEEGPANDMGEGPGNDMEEGPANDMGEGPESDMEEGPGNVVEGLANEVKEVSADGVEGFEVVTTTHVEERTPNQIEEGTSKEVGEGPENDMEEGPANDMGEGPENETEEGPGNVVEGLANEVKEVSADGVEGFEVVTTSHVEERTPNQIEEGTSKEVGDVEVEID